MGIELMFYLNIEKSCYKRIKNLLPEIKPDIKILLINCDDNLQKLGFCSDAPCTIGFDLCREEMNDLLDELMQIEVDAFNTIDGEEPSGNSCSYQRYIKYGWLWDVLYCAEEDISKAE